MNKNQNNNPQNSDEEFWKKVVSDSDVRRAITRENFKLFFTIYFANAMQYKFAPFHESIMGILQDQTNKFIVLEAFRNSAKTTLANKAYAIWSIIGTQQKKCVLIVAQTQEQARHYLTNIKKKMCEEPLRSDMGPFEEPSDEWRSSTIVISNYKARIIVASAEQSIRGLLHDTYRPDLIICDDLENLASVKSLEARNRLYDWFTGDILPLGDRLTRTIVIGTRPHEDSIIMRLKDDIEKGRRNGIMLSYPIINAEGKIAWPDKYPDMAAIEAEKKRIGNEEAWQQEFLLEPTSKKSQIIQREWIQYYDNLPITRENYLLTITAVDPAVGETEKHDFTAIISAEIHVYNGELQIYILPNPINERMNYPDLLDRLKLISKSLGNGYSTLLVIEDVAFQKAAIQDLEKCGYYVKGFRPGGADKHARLSFTTGMIKSAKILFPRNGTEELINQIVFFPNVKHDDLVDAFSMLVLQAMLENRNRPSITFMEW